MNMCIIITHTNVNKQNHHGLCISPSKHVALICQLLKASDFRLCGNKPVMTELTSAEAAEEMFELTGNPSRQEEREQRYGNDRSVSVGDVIMVITANKVEYWLCDSAGWLMLDIDNDKIADY